MVTVKSMFYKFCFCLGLGTASYYSYATVQHFVKGSPSEAASTAPEASILQNKLQAIASDASLSPEQRQFQMNRIAQQANSFVQNPNASVALSAVKPLIVAAPAEADAAAVAADPNASPTPPEGEKKDEAKKDGEKKEGEEAKTAENADGAVNPDGSVAGVPAQPFYPEAMANYQLAMQQQQQAAQPVASPEAANPSANAPTGMPAGFNSALAAGNTGSGSGTTASNTSSGYTGTNYSNNGAATPTTGASVLTQEDLTTLTAPVQAAFQDQQNKVNGYVCAETQRSSCTYQNDVSVHSLRWGTDEGLEKSVNFAVKAGSGATPVQFDVSFKIQDRLLNDQTVALTAKPSEVLVHSESRDSKTYKVYEFKMPDTTVRSDDALTQMQATLVYEVTPTGMVMSSDSKFSFSRDQVKTSETSWDPGTADRTPAQNELYFVADELPYSMSLQKSP